MEGNETQKTALPLPTCGLKDVLCTCMILLLLPAGVAVFFCSLALLLLPLCFIRAVICCCPSHRFQRHELYNFGFDLTVVVVLLISLPLFILAHLWALVVAVLIFVFSLPIFIFRPIRTCKSWLTLVSGAQDMTTMHYSSWGVFEDLTRAAAALLGRRRAFDCWISTALMIAFTPIYKFATFNPMLFDLQVVFVNQWTDVMGSESVFLGVLRRALKSILCTQPLPETASFGVVVQCPSPHKSRLDNTVLGIQMEPCYPAQLFPATHGLNPSERSHGEWTLVGLPFNSSNPFCSLVGHMEVDLRQDGALQCPMWLVMDPDSRMNVQLVGRLRRSWSSFLGYLATEARVQAATFLQQQEQMHTDYAHKYSLLPRRVTTSSSNDEITIDIGRHSSPSCSTSVGPFLVVPPSPTLTSTHSGTTAATTSTSTTSTTSAPTLALPAAAGKYPPPPPLLATSSATTSLPSSSPPTSPIVAIPPPSGPPSPATSAPPSPAPSGPPSPLPSPSPAPAPSPAPPAEPTTPVMPRAARIATLKSSEVPALGGLPSEEEVVDEERKKREAKIKRVRYLKRKKERERQEEENLARNQQERLKRLLQQGEEAEEAYQQELLRAASEEGQT